MNIADKTAQQFTRIRLKDRYEFLDRCPRVIKEICWNDPFGRLAVGPQGFDKIMRGEAGDIIRTYNSREYQERRARITEKTYGPDHPQSWTQLFGNEVDKILAEID